MRIQTTYDQRSSSSATTTFVAGLLLSCLIVGIPLLVYGLWLMAAPKKPIHLVVLNTNAEQQVAVRTYDRTVAEEIKGALIQELRQA